MFSQKLKETINNDISNEEVRKHIIDVGRKYASTIQSLNGDTTIIESIFESPKTKKWMTETVFPELFINGENGLNKILIDVEKEENSLLGASKFHILINVVANLPFSLNVLQDGYEEGNFKLEETLRHYENNVKIRQKFLH
jgi:hypothetical protein